MEKYMSYFSNKSLKVHKYFIFLYIYYFHYKIYLKEKKVKVLGKTVFHL